MSFFSPIKAVILRHLLMWRRDPNYAFGVFYWPLLDIVTWGFLGSWIQTQSQAPQFQNYEMVALLGVLLWQIIGRGGNIMVFAFAEEFWSGNLINMFSLPLRLTEWMIGVIILTLINIVAMIALGILVIYALYNVSLWYMVKIFLMFAPALFLSTLWLGFTCLQIVVTLGRRSVELAFVFLWFLLPLSGAYYPIEVMPGLAQVVTAFLPMSYIFQGMRAYVMFNQNPVIYIVKGALLGAVYAFCAVVLFVYCFNRSKVKGLARLMD